MLRALMLAAAGLVLACAGSPADAADSVPSYITAAVADGARPEADRARDAERKPAATLAFSLVRPGDNVVELAPGRGYYTRLLSAAVGPRGHVYALVAPPEAGSDHPAVPNAALQALASDPHYANVTVLVQPYYELTGVPAARVDLAWTSENYHDFHNLPDVDVYGINRAIWQVLRPGGTYLITDHAAARGSGARDTATLHRIDPQLVLRELLDANYELNGASDALRNPGDPHTAKVFDDSIRGHTDQFILRFRKLR